MPKFDLLTKPSYLADRRKLSRELQLKVLNCEELLVKNVRHPGLQTKRVQQQKDLFEARVDQRYRVLYSHQGNIIQLLAVGPHDVLEQRLRIPAVSEEARTLAKRSIEPSAGARPASRWGQVDAASIGGGGASLPVKLPVEITEALLRQLGIPAEWHPPLLACSTEDGLLESPVPEPYRERLLDYLYPKSISGVLDEPSLEVQSVDALRRHSERERSPMAFPRHAEPQLQLGTRESARGARPTWSRSQLRGRRVIPRWTLAGGTPEDRAEELYSWLISEVDAGRSPLCTYKAAVDMVLHLKKFTPAYLAQLLRLATKCGRRPIEGLGDVQLDTFLVNQTYKPGDGHWARVNYSAETWQTVFAEAPVIE